MKQNNILEVYHLGLLEYQAAISLMHNLREKRLQGAIPDTLLFLEHPPVITMGRQDASADFKLSAEEIRSKGVHIVQTDRGGRLTYHGPGQLVIYFILQLAEQKLTVDSLVCKAEAGLIEILEEYGIKSSINKSNPGLWIGNNKIASVGFHIHKGVTTHGVSLNVTNDLTPFTYMTPCGVKDAGQTSLFGESGQSPTLAQLAQKLAVIYAREFELNAKFATCPV